MIKERVNDTEIKCKSKFCKNTKVISYKWVIDDIKLLMIEHVNKM